MSATRFLALAALLLGFAAPALAEDVRTPIKLAPEIRAQLREEMRGHMEALDDIIAALAARDFPRASAGARASLGVGGGKGLGRFMPVEFRQMGMEMHRSALDFADAAGAVAGEPAAADWQKAMSALATLSATCRGCHGAFRIE
ncbi:MAG: hypothetical protein AB1918_07325 [Pseudomonadota bacterium]